MDNMLLLFAGLRRSLGVEKNTFDWSLALKRARYNTRPQRRMVEAAVRDFLARAPLSDVRKLATSLDGDLSDAGYVRIQGRVMQILAEDVALPIKDPFVFSDIVRRLLEPLAPS